MKCAWKAESRKKTDLKSDYKQRSYERFTKICYLHDIWMLITSLFFIRFWKLNIWSKSAYIAKSRKNRFEIELQTKKLWPIYQNESLTWYLNAYNFSISYPILKVVYTVKMCLKCRNQEEPRFEIGLQTKKLWAIYQNVSLTWYLNTYNFFVSYPI